MTAIQPSPAGVLGSGGVCCTSVGAHKGTSASTLHYFLRYMYLLVCVCLSVWFSVRTTYKKYKCTHAQTYKQTNKHTHTPYIIFQYDRAHNVDGAPRKKKETTVSEYLA